MVDSDRIAISAKNVCIRYKTGDFKNIGLKEWTVRMLKRNYHVEYFMAVDGVSFELEKGEMLGIVGANGAGKSTLLKAISGIMEPSTGTIHRCGNIAALLELGSGFDGDLTVKENIYLRGAILGYSKKYIEGLYKSVLSFAELEAYEERPFKHLSSGMKARLAFSVSCLVKPEILILDEVLAVGDGAFQEKSKNAMMSIINGETTTILVSHSLQQIREMCTRILWLDHGGQITYGSDVQGICDQYQHFLDTGEIPTQPIQ